VSGLPAFALSDHAADVLVSLAGLCIICLIARPSNAKQNGCCAQGAGS